ncbi:MAG: response regulator transcription factor [Erysipelotrichaceae bacterium]
MENNLILVVEDDTAINNLIKTTLQMHDYRYINASTGKEALQLITSHTPDVILLDLGLPDMDGTTIIKTVRGWSNNPIIVISARSDDSDKIAALDLGADDYLTKPFSIDELLARLRVALRRINNTQTQMPIFNNGDLVIDYTAGCVFLKDMEIHLTPMEYKLVVLLSQNVGKVLTHTYITKQIWGSVYESDIASLRVFMATLRKKLEKDSSNPVYIQTHVGVGYRMLKL